MVGSFSQRNITWFAFLLLLQQLASAEMSPAAGRLMVDIENPSIDIGPIRVCLFSSPDGFPDNPRKALVCVTHEETDHSSFYFENVPFGTIAASAYQDSNKNGRLDKGWLGIPKEPVGVSQANQFKPERPRFKTAVFLFDQNGMKIQIHLHKGIAK